MIFILVIILTPSISLSASTMAYPRAGRLFVGMSESLSSRPQRAGVARSFTPSSKVLTASSVRPAVTTSLGIPVGTLSSEALLSSSPLVAKWQSEDMISLVVGHILCVVGIRTGLDGPLDDCTGVFGERRSTCTLAPPNPKLLTAA